MTQEEPRSAPGATTTAASPYRHEEQEHIVVMEGPVTNYAFSYVCPEALYDFLPEEDFVQIIDELNNAPGQYASMLVLIPIIALMILLGPRSQFSPGFTVVSLVLFTLLSIGLAVHLSSKSLEDTDRYIIALNRRYQKYLRFRIIRLDQNLLGARYALGIVILAPPYPASAVDESPAYILELDERQTIHTIEKPRQNFANLGRQTFNVSLVRKDTEEKPVSTTEHTTWV